MPFSLMKDYNAPLLRLPRRRDILACVASAMIRVPVATLTLTCLLGTGPAIAGPYVPGGPTGELFPVAFDDPTIAGWATGFTTYLPGPGVASEFADARKALGPSQPRSSGDIVSLGRGGSITLTFDAPIVDGSGADFAVFENAFDVPGQGRFAELAWVEVSSDGTNFIRFPNVSLTPSPVGAFGLLDPTDLAGLAGKTLIGQGTAFDLEVLAQVPILDVNDIRYLRVVDIVGDGSARDSIGNPIYDPYPTEISAGFDLEAVAVLNQGVPVEPPARAEERVPLPVGILALAPLLAGIAVRTLEKARRR